MTALLQRHAVALEVGAAVGLSGIEEQPKGFIGHQSKSSHVGEVRLQLVIGIAYRRVAVSVGSPMSTPARRRAGRDDSLVSSDADLVASPLTGGNIAQVACVPGAADPVKAHSGADEPLRAAGPTPRALIGLGAERLASNRRLPHRLDATAARRGALQCRRS